MFGVQKKKTLTHKKLLVMSKEFSLETGDRLAYLWNKMNVNERETQVWLKIRNCDSAWRGLRNGRWRHRHSSWASFLRAGCRERSAGDRQAGVKVLEEILTRTNQTKTWERWDKDVQMASEKISHANETKCLTADADRKDRPCTVTKPGWVVGSSECKLVSNFLDCSPQGLHPPETSSRLLWAHMTPCAYLTWLLVLRSQSWFICLLLRINSNSRC